MPPEMHIGMILAVFDIPSQYALQKEINPQIPEGYGLVYANPPYHALIFSVFAFLPYPAAFILWSLLSLGFLVWGAWLISKFLLPQAIKSAGVGFSETIALIFLFFPTILGLITGQTHNLNFFLLLLVLTFALKKQDCRSGIAAGFLILKPQFALGFAILWLVTKNWRALLGFLGVSLLLSVAVLLTAGIQPFFSFLNAIDSPMTLTYADFHYQDETTLFSLLYAVFKMDYPLASRLFILMVPIIYVSSLIWIRRAAHHMNEKKIITTLVLAALFPFMLSPHALVYSLVLLLPILPLLAGQYPSRALLWSSLFLFILPWIYRIFISLTGIIFPWLSILPLMLLTYTLWQFHRSGNEPEISAALST